METFFDYVSPRTFWRVLLFLHFVMALILLAVVTLQAVAVLMPVRQAAGNFVSRVRAVSPSSYVLPIVILYVPTFLLGAWVYVKYRTYVRIPMEQLGHWWTVGSFEIKEHVVSFGMGLLLAYWYVWRQPSEEYANVRKWLTVFLAFSVWYAFLIGHIANDFRGVGA
jgi:hypothetical protein